MLIGEDRPVKLVDLGTATAGHLTQITAENEVMGTLVYIAPERLAGESVGEPASDVYSLAVLAFEALTGRQPNRVETPAKSGGVVPAGDRRGPGCSRPVSHATPISEKARSTR